MFLFQMKLEVSCVCGCVGVYVRLCVLSETKARACLKLSLKIAMISVMIVFKSNCKESKNMQISLAIGSDELSSSNFDAYPFHLMQ
jgi:hypothetical protein